jgi:hypothetical protein
MRQMEIESAQEIPVISAKCAQWNNELIMVRRRFVELLDCNMRIRIFGLQFAHRLFDRDVIFMACSI